MEQQLNHDHFLLLRIAAGRKRQLPGGDSPSHAINKLTFIMFGSGVNSAQDKEYVRGLLRDLRNAGYMKTKFLKTKEDPQGVYKWVVTGLGYNLVKEEWEKFYEQVKIKKDYGRG